MRPIFVKTQNAQAFLAGLQALEQRGANEACLAVVDGEPGLGKSATVHWWAVQAQAVFLRAKKEWTPPWFLRELLGELRKIPEHSFERMFRQTVQALGERAAGAERDGQPFGVVIDEVDYISRSSRLLETVRDLSDMLEIPIILVGMGRVRHNLTRFPQVASRVGQYIEFKPAPLEDTRAMVAGLCEVPVQDDLVAFLHKVSGGRSRETKEGIAAIERFGRRNPDPNGVGLVAMSGQVLLNDRASGKPILVRA
jgi:DNA transposition AAA+ family ATPase